jgi:hypothetical protein
MTEKLPEHGPEKPSNLRKNVRMAVLGALLCPGSFVATGAAISYATGCTFNINIPAQTNIEKKEKVSQEELKKYFKNVVLIKILESQPPLDKEFNGSFTLRGEKFDLSMMLHIEDGNLLVPYVIQHNGEVVVDDVLKFDISSADFEENGMSEVMENLQKYLSPDYGNSEANSDK